MMTPVHTAKQEIGGIKILWLQPDKIMFKPALVAFQIVESSQVLMRRELTAVLFA